MNVADKYSLKCPICSKAYPPASDIFSCEGCKAPTVVAMNTAGAALFEASDDRSMWRYFALLPLNDRASIVSQGEGQTPLMVSPRLADHLSVGSLLLKNETVNPTGSFKDRQVSLGISKAKESGAHTLAVISSGNVAAAAASYAAIAGLKCIIFAPYNAPEEKLVQARDLSPAEVVANPVEVGDTIAGAIADDILFDAYTALPAIRESGGRAVSIGDDEMLEAEALLACKAGVFAEPASASTIAAIGKLRDANAIGSGDSVCCIITGSGFKDMASAKSLVGVPTQIEANIQAFLQLD